MSPTEPPELPGDIPEDKLRELGESIEDGCRKLGLYMTGIALNVDTEPDPGEKPNHTLVVQFQIGDIAFSPRIQDPETERMDQEFRHIERGNVDDEIEAIRARYQQQRQDEGSDGEA